MAFTLPSLATLLAVTPSTAVYAKFISLAKAVKMNVEAWAVGDPTRSELSVLASYLGDILEPGIQAAISGGFLGLARGDWLTLKSALDYNTPRIGAEAATCEVLLTNSKGGVFAFSAGQVTVMNPSTSQTYRSTGYWNGSAFVSSGTLGSMGTLRMQVEAEVAGSVGTAAPGTITAMVTTFTGVTCSNTSAAVGVDTESDDDLTSRSQLVFEATSPDGPLGAYEYYAETPSLNGGANVTRARSYGLTTNGKFPTYLASASGAASSGDVALVQAACLANCTPIGITPQFLAASDLFVTIGYSLSVYSDINLTNAQIQAAVDAALIALFRSEDIGADIVPPATIGILSVARIESTILGACDTVDGNGAVVARHGINVALSAPLADVGIANNQVPIYVSAGTPTTITQVKRKR